MRELYVDDYAQKANIGRVAMALGYGLNPYHFSRPFPGTTPPAPNIIIPPAPATPPAAVPPQPATAAAVVTVASRKLWPVVMAAVLGTGTFTGMTAALISATSGVTSPPPVPAAVDPETPPPLRGRIKFFYQGQEIAPETEAAAQGNQPAA